mgnify:CR=1 FL=1
MLQAHIGGLKQYFLTLFEELLASDEENQYVFFHFPHNAEQLRMLRSTRWRDTAVPIREQEEIRDHLSKIDLLFCPFGALWPRPIPIPGVVTLVDIQEVFYPEFFSRLDHFNREYHFRGSARLADRVLTISEFSKRTIVEHYGVPDSRIVVSHLSADERYSLPLDRPVELPGYIPKDGYMFYPANRWLHKNHDTLLKALQMLRERGLVVPAVFTGYDMQGGYPLMERAREHGIADQVQSLEYVSPEQMIGLYTGARMLVFPSLFEGFGIPVVEAMSVGCPVIASRATSLPEIGGDAVEYFDPKSAGELSRAIERLWVDKSLRDQLARKGRIRARAFSARGTAEAHKRAFAEAERAFCTLKYVWSGMVCEKIHRTVVFLKHWNVLRAQARGEVGSGLAVVFGAGWHGREQYDHDWIRWSSGRGEIVITMPHDGALELRGEFACIRRPDTVSLRLDGKTVAEWATSAEEFAFRPFDPVHVRVGAGRHVVEIVNANPPIVQRHDSRPLAIAVRNLEVSILPGTQTTGTNA